MTDFLVFLLVGAGVILLLKGVVANIGDFKLHEFEFLKF